MTYTSAKAISVSLGQGIWIAPSMEITCKFSLAYPCVWTWESFSLSSFSKQNKQKKSVSVFRSLNFHGHLGFWWRKQRPFGQQLWGPAFCPREWGVTASLVCSVYFMEHRFNRSEDFFLVYGKCEGLYMCVCVCESLLGYGVRASNEVWETHPAPLCLATVFGPGVCVCRC